jgi:gas vesicle protein
VAGAVDQLTYDLVVETKKAVLDIKSALNKSDQQAAKAGKSSGASFGKSFASAATAILGAISFNALIGGIQEALGAYREMQGANVALSGAIKFVNNQATKTNSILASNTTSYEEKATAIGLDTDKLYTNTKATQSNEGAIKAQEASIRSAERAYEDSIKVQEQNVFNLNQQTDAIDKQIKSLNKQTDEQIKQIRIARGYDAVDNELNLLEIQKNQLEIQRDTAKIANDGVALAEAKNQIATLDDEISLRKNKLDAIDFETDAIKKQAKTQEDAFKSQKDNLVTQITVIRSELSEAKNKFDIDIEPAKRKLEDLRATNISVGGGKVISEEMKKFIDQASEKAKINIPAKINEDDVNKSIESVKKNFQVKGKDIISTATFKQAYGDLLKGGVTSLDAVEKTVTQFIESASVGRSAGVSLEKAVGNLGYAFRTNNSQIGNLSGIQENWSDITKDGTAQLEAQYIAMGDLDSARRVSLGLLTDEEQVKAKLIGLDKVTQDSQGAFNDLAETGALDTEIFNQQLKTFQQVLGEKLLPVLGEIIPPLADMLDKVIEFTKNNPQLVTGVLLAVTAFTGLLTAGFALAFVIKTIGIAVGFLAGPIGLAVLAVAGLLAILTLLYNNSETFRTTINQAFSTVQQKIEEVVKSFNEKIKPEIETIFKEIETIFKKIEPIITPFINSFVTFLTGSIDNVSRIFSGLVTTISGVFTLISGILTGDGDKIRKGFEKIFSGLGNMIAGFLNQAIDSLNQFLRSLNSIGDQIQEATGVNVSDIPEIPKIPTFADGGLVTGKGTGRSDSIPAMLSNGEFVMNAQSVRRFFPILQAMNSNRPIPNQTDNRQINSGNTNNYYNYSNGGNQFTPTYMT